ncbi:energy transducer TonB [Mucilaginibacter angelicae]|uniref:Energy transducer TonB n=1 Tax=Mucilaginibacter angelicae TaxID=869718 RepID=A0ABV6LFR1_9SPHI
MIKAVLLIFSGCILANTCIAQAQKGAINPDTLGVIVCVFTTDPEFPGGIDGLRSFIKKKLRWPGKGYDDIEGRVIVTFTVETSGELTNIKVVRGLSSEIDKEAIRLMRKSPKWKPAFQNGKPKRVQYSMPISFIRDYD